MISMMFTSFDNLSRASYSAFSFRLREQQQRQQWLGRHERQQLRRFGRMLSEMYSDCAKKSVLATICDLGRLILKRRETMKLSKA